MLITAMLAMLLLNDTPTAGTNAFADRFQRGPMSRGYPPHTHPPPWRPIGPAPASKPEVVAFYGEDATVKGHPEDTCTPSFWLDFPPNVVTTIIMQVSSRIWLPSLHCCPTPPLDGSESAGNLVDFRRKHRFF